MELNAKASDAEAELRAIIKRWADPATGQCYRRMAVAARVIEGRYSGDCEVSGKLATQHMGR